ncbi:MAG: arsenate reductase [Flavobacteriaceae bacterium]|nr:arsenate reductase [Flavobacteriaceae bacterium]
MKYKLLHNPRCRKSREGLQFLKSKKIEFETVLYLLNRLNKNQIEEIIDNSELNPIDFVRKQEKIWKEMFKNKLLSKNQVIQAIFEHPKIMQRPIFISKNKSIIANPPENSLKIL